MQLFLHVKALSYRDDKYISVELLTLQFKYNLPVLYNRLDIRSCMYGLHTNEIAKADVCYALSNSWN